MKYSICGFIFLLSVFFLLGFRHLNSRVVNNGAVGDVKYSVLPPDLFFAVNGSDWVLVDGRDISNSTLAKMGCNRIPDLRGLFIRAMDMGRDTIDGKGDPDWKGRNIIDLQRDTFQRHNHSLDIKIGHGLWSYGDNTPGIGWACQWKPNEREAHNDGGIETRPKNIALYVYAKINDTK